MNMKVLLISAFSLFLFGAANTQDRRSGNTEENTSTDETVSLDGSPRPGYHPHSGDRMWCSTQIVALAPFQYSENGVGVGLSYERALDPDGVISLYVPFIATFNLSKNRDYYYGT